MPRRQAARSRAIGIADRATHRTGARRAIRSLLAVAVGAAALAAWASPAAAVEPTVTRNCDGTATVNLMSVPTNLTASVHNVRIVGDQVLFEIHYDWQDDSAPEQIEQRALALPPIPADCTPETTPPPTTTPTTPPPGGFTFSVSPICINDAPFLSFSASIPGFAPGTPMVLHWLDENGVEQFTQNVTLGAGQVVWPGAEVAAQGGEPIDWPGWVTLPNGEWIQADDGFVWARGSVGIFATVNPTSPTASASYPLPSPDCRTDPPETGGSTLPATGDDSQVPLVAVGMALLAAGAGLVIVTRQRTRTSRIG